MRRTSAILLIAMAGWVIPVPARSQTAPVPVRGRVAHVLVALADNQFQGIVPVPAAIGNGDDPVRNLYWGAGYGLRTFLNRSADWQIVGRCRPGNGPVLERCIFRHRQEPVYVVADAYRGREIKQAISDFFAYAAGHLPEDSSTFSPTFCTSLPNPLTVLQPDSTATENRDNSINATKRFMGDSCGRYSRPAAGGPHRTGRAV